MKQKLHFLPKILLLALFLSYYGETTLFYHTHKTLNGLVTHSHPFRANHNHSQNELETIHWLSIILFVFTIHSFLNFVRAFYRLIFSRKQYNYTPLSLKSNLLRAPPMAI